MPIILRLPNALTNECIVATPLLTCEQPNQHLTQPLLWQQNPPARLLPPSLAHQR